MRQNNFSHAMLAKEAPFAAEGPCMLCILTGPSNSSDHEAIKVRALLYFRDRVTEGCCSCFVEGFTPLGVSQSLPVSLRDTCDTNRSTFSFLF